MFNHLQVRAWIFVALTSLLLGYTQPIMADVPEYSTYLDRSSQLTAGQVYEKEFTSNNNKYVVLGFEKATLWVKLPIAPNTHHAAFEYLSVWPANIIESQLLQFKDQQWVQIPKNDNSLRLFSFKHHTHSIFEIPKTSDPITLLLKVTSPGSIGFRIEVNSLEQMNAEIMQLSSSLFFYLGLIISPFLLLIWFGFRKRDPFLLSIALWLIANAVLRLLHSAIAIPDWTINTAHLGQLIFYGLLPLFHCLTLLSLLYTYRVSARVRHFSLACSVLVVLAMAVFLMFPEMTQMRWLQLPSLTPLVILVVLPLFTNVRQRVGGLLACVCAVAGFISLAFRLALLGLDGRILEALVGLNLQLPFAALLCAAVISRLRQETIYQTILNERNKRLEEERLFSEQRKNNQQRQFLLMLTHELKNSLSVLKLFVYMKSDREKFTKLAGQSINDISEIIDRSIEVDRIDRKEVSLLNTSFCLIDLIQSLINANNQEHRFKFEPQKSTCPITTDQLLLKTIVSNLLDNSLKYSEPHSTIYVEVKSAATLNTVSKRGPGIVLSVRNEVIAGSMPQAARIFEKYYRGPLANKSSGSGLGLYLSKSMTALIGGELSFSALNMEVEFDLWIPS